jgi:hypothetical protein
MKKIITTDHNLEKKICLNIRKIPSRKKKIDNFWKELKLTREVNLQLINQVYINPHKRTTMIMIVIRK